MDILKGLLKRVPVAMRLPLPLLLYLLLPLLLPLFAACSREFESPYLPSSPDYAGAEWSLDHDGDGVADSVEKYAPGCEIDPLSCLNLAQDQSQAGAVKPPQDTSKPGPGNAIPVASISAPELRLIVGETRAAQVQLLPVNATSRNYELSSQDGDVAVVRPAGIYATGEGSTFITMHALDGSDVTGRFRVTVIAP